MEIGIRFLTGYLKGDVYFKQKRPGHNPDRSCAQLALARCIEAREDAIKALRKDLNE